MKQVPSPRAESIQIAPPLWLTIPWTVESPRPVPSPTSFVREEGLEDLLGEARIDAGAGVADDERDVRAGDEVGVGQLVVLPELQPLRAEREIAARPASHRGR